MPDVGLPELLIILAIAVLLFGASRLADVGGAFGSAIRDFRRELREDVEGESIPTDEDHTRAAHR
jgi:sec-independent protein translocase protein TatA